MKSYLSLIPISARVRKRQNRMTLLCIVISVFLVTAIFSVSDMFLRAENRIQQNKHGSWHLRISGLTPDIAEEIGRRPDVTAVGWSDSFNADAEQPCFAGDRKAALYGADEVYLTQLMNGLEEGAFPKREDEAVLNPDAGIALNVRIGDRVTVHTPAGDADFTVTGFGTDDKDYYQGQTYLVAVYLTRDAFRRLLAQNGIPESPVCSVQFHSAKEASEAKAELSEKYGIPPEHISENTAVMGLAGQSGTPSLNGIYAIAVFLFALVLTAGVLMISGSLNSSVAQRTQFFGMMRCVGASRRQIIRFVRLEALNWCRTAVPAGLILGTAASWGVCACLRYGIGGDEFSSLPVVSVSPVGLVCGMLVGVITVLLASQAPAKRAAKVSPMLAVSGNAELPRGSLHRMKFYFGRMEFVLGIHHATGSRKNWFLMTASYALSIILILCFSVGLSFARGLLPSLHDYQPDLTLNGYANALVLAPELTDKIRQIPGVESAFGSSYLQDIPAAVSRPGIDRINLESYDDTLLALAENSVMQGEISGIFGDSGQAMTIRNKDNPLEVGDVIRIGENEVRITCSVSSGIFPSERLVICSQETFARLTGEQNYTMIGIRLNGEADDTTLKQINRFAGSDVIFSDQSKSNAANNATYRAVQVVVYGFLAIISLITLFHTVNSVSISTAARIRQYGAMRAAGMSGRQLTGMIAAEALTYALSGLVAGCGIGIPLSRMLHIRLVTRYFGTPWRPPAAMLGIIFLFVFACSVISVHAPAKRIRHMPITAVINEL